MTIVETERLILTTWQQEYIKPMAAISADPKVMEFFPSTQTLAYIENLIATSIKIFEECGYCLFPTILKANNEFIGFVGLSHPGFEIPNFKPTVKPVVEIGWRLAAKHWGQGYATEAATAVLQFAFNKAQLREIVSFTASSNKKSIRVMEKIGMQYHMDFLNPKVEDGHPLKPHVLYLIMNKDANDINKF